MGECANCGNEAPEGAIFCLNCQEGSGQEEIPEQVQQDWSGSPPGGVYTPPPKSGGSGGYKVFAIIAISLLIVGGIITATSGITFRPDVDADPVDAAQDMQNKNELGAFLYEIGSILMEVGLVLFILIFGALALNKENDMRIRVTSLVGVVVMIYVIWIFFMANPVLRLGGVI